MGPPTPEEEKQVEWFERQLRGERRILLHNAPRDEAGLKKVTDWQLEQLAKALELDDAVVGVFHMPWPKLARRRREGLLLTELLSWDQQRYTTKKFTDPSYWSELMQKYLKKELEDALPVSP